MNVLIVEDNQHKAVTIGKLLQSSISNCETTLVGSIAVAYRTIEFKKPDGIILDMTFQASQGIDRDIRKETLAGIELLQFLNRKMIAIPVIVATQHTNFSNANLPMVHSIESLDKELALKFKRNHKGIVLVDLSTDEWKSQLVDLVVGNF